MKEIQSIINQYIENGNFPGVEWKIQYKENIIQGKSGYLNLTDNIPIKTNSIYRIWSMTKPIISIIILQLVEEGKVQFTDPLNLFLPEFNNLKVLKKEDSFIDDVIELERIPTIKDLLLHTAGFSYNFLDDPVGKIYEKKKLFHSSYTTLEEEIKILSSCPLLFEPSKRWNYSVSIDILARIIEIILNNTIQNVLTNRIFQPLEMFDTSFSLNESQQDRLMTSYEYNIKEKKLTNLTNQGIGAYGYPLNELKYARGGHGLYSSLNDYFKFAEMLMNGKTKSKKTILSKKMLNLATINHLNKNYFPLEIPIPENENTENFMEPYGWGLGFRVLIDLKKSNYVGSVGEFGWSGAAATYFLVDPKKNLTAVLMTQVLNATPELNKNFRDIIYSNLI